MIDKFLQECFVKSNESVLTNEEILEAYFEYCKYNRIIPSPKRRIRSSLPKEMLLRYGAAQRHDINNSRRGFKGVAIMSTPTVSQPPQDIFDLLGVSRKEETAIVAATTQTVSATATTPAVKSRQQYEEMLVGLEKKKVQIEMAITKCQGLVKMLDEIERVEKDISRFLYGDLQSGDDSAPPVKQTTGAGEQKTNRSYTAGNTTAMLRFLLEAAGPQTMSEIATGTNLSINTVSGWLYGTASKHGYAEKAGRKEGLVSYRITEKGISAVDKPAPKPTSKQNIDTAFAIMEEIAAGNNTLHKIADATKKDLQRVANWLRNHPKRVSHLGGGIYTLTAQGMMELQENNNK